MTVGHRLPLESAWRALALAATMAVVLALVPLSGAFAQVDRTNTVDLDAGDNIGTAIAWSQLAFADGSATDALLGRHDVFADNLASGLPQGVSDAPLLLNPTDELNENVLEELNRLGVDTVHILGGELAISEDVVDELEAEGFDTQRYSGPTRIETAVDIAAAFAPNATQAIVSRAFGNEGGDETQAFADALAAGAWAAEDEIPVLFTQQDVLTGSTADYLQASDITEVFVVGGTQAVSNGVVAEIEAHGIDVTRVSGSNRFATAVAVAEARGYTDAGDAVDGVILVEGQAADAWADGFSAAFFAANPKPVVLSNGDEVPPETEAFLSGGDASTTLFCGPKVSDEACNAAADILGQGQGAGLTLDSTSVQRGQAITGNVANMEDVDTITVSGACVNDGTVTPDANGDFSVQTTSDATQGECEVTFTVTFDDGNVQEFTFTVTVTAPAQFTSAPELVSVELANETATQRSYRYIFSHEVISTPILQTGFVLYPPNTNERRTSVQAQRDPNNTSAVLAVFNLTPADAGDEVREATLAAVERNVVQDAAGRTNPMDSVDLAAVTFAAGQTRAPDLVSVTNVDATNETADFTFDTSVTTFSAAAGAFELVLGTDVNAAHLDSTSATPVAGTNNTVLRVTFAAPGINLATDPVRGVSNQGAVTGANAVSNPTQTADVTGSSGNSNAPDLVSVTLDTTNDRVTYTFDENVETLGTAGNRTLFRVFYTDGSTSAASTAATERNATDARVVVAQFPDGTVNNLVTGAVALEGAVQRPGVTGRFNLDDEEGVAQTFATGSVLGPELVSADKADVRDVLGNVTGRSVTYTFDKAVAAAVTSANFFVFNDTGTATAFAGGECTRVSTNTSQVRCEVTPGGNATTNTAIGNAVAAGVANNAVTRNDAVAIGGGTVAQPNPEGLDGV